MTRLTLDDLQAPVVLRGGFAALEGEEGVPFEERPPEFYLARLDNVVARGGQWWASCPLPGHKNGDANPSLSIRRREHGGTYLHCFSRHQDAGITLFKAIAARTPLDEDPSCSSRARAQRAPRRTAQVHPLPVPPPDATKMLPHALMYWRQTRWSIFPLHYRTKRPALKHWKPYQYERPKWGHVDTWWTRWPHAGIALVTGEISSVVVIEEDREGALAELGPVPETLTAHSARGRHFYFEHPGRWVKTRPDLVPDVDVRGDGGFVVLPPSVHPSGHVYAWERRMRPQPLPEHLAALL